MYHFSHALPINEVKAEQFDLLFLAGRYGAMWDFHYNKKLQQLINQSLHANKPVGLAGHAAATLILLTTANKEPFLKGLKLTAFSIFFLL
jgi:putative intracellular protease/amidase